MREPELEPIRGRVGALPRSVLDLAGGKARTDEAEAGREKEERQLEDLTRSC
jgi:hypothetical protein